MLKFRLILFTVIIFYFINSQVSPYFHFHHHDYKSSDQPAISTETLAKECHHPKCCVAHLHNHKMLETDWIVLKSLTVDLSSAILVVIQGIIVNPPGESIAFIVLPETYHLEFILTANSNKAPPFYV